MKRDCMFQPFNSDDQEYLEERRGYFHQWAVDFEEFEQGPAGFTYAIVEDEEGNIHKVIDIKRIRFVPHHQQDTRQVIILQKDGDQWCALVGPNPQEGVAGFGESIPAALTNLAGALSVPK